MSQQIDPRGQQLAAASTGIVLTTVLLTAPGTVGVGLLTLQAVLFATAVVLGVHRTPAAILFRTVVRPRLGPPAHLEDPEPPRFAQGLGLAFVVVALAGFLLGAPAVGYAATGLALVAALLNATIGLCLGCEIYLLARRLQSRTQPIRIPAPGTPSTNRSTP
jgi:hypothetical protein